MSVNYSIECQEATAIYSPCEAEASQLHVELAGQGLSMHVADSLASMLQLLYHHPLDSVLIDLRRDADAGVAVVRAVRQEHPDIGIVVMATVERIDAARTALQAGADDFLTEGLSADLVAATLRLVGSTYRLRLENRNFVNAQRKVISEPCLSGGSPVIRRLQAAIERAANNDVTILIEGKPGTGKTMVANMVHGLSRAKDRGLIALSCEGLSESRLMSALTRGDEGTLLLEDVDCLPPATQAELVKFFKERQQPDGKLSSSVKRVIATTAARLAELTAKGVFREDLYYRLNVFPLAIPSLKERQEDISSLAIDLLNRSANANNLADRGFTPAAMILLETNPWPENISQLKNAILRAHALAAGNPIDRIHLLGPVSGITVSPGVVGLSDAMDCEPTEVSEEEIRPFQEEERRILGRALIATRGNVRRAAQLLGIGRATLYRKIQVYDLPLR